MKAPGVNAYRRFILSFVIWCGLNNIEPEESWEYDDLLTEYAAGSGDAGSITKSQFQGLIAAVEKILPHLKGNLPLARGCLASWSVSFTPRHAVPLNLAFACYLGMGLCDLGMPTVAVLLVLQAGLGLRPSEALGLTRYDLLLPWEIPKSGGAGLVLLGVKRGTKSGRPQTVRAENPLVIALMQLVRLVMTTTGRLTGIRSLAGYAWCLRAAMQHMKIPEAGWTPHSPRAGFVTDMYIAGKQPAEIASFTRHMSIKPLRSYLDAASVTSGQLAIYLRGHQGAAARAELMIVDRVKELLAPDLKWG